MFEKKVKIQIKSLAGNLLFEYECADNTIKKTVMEAISKKADLSSANLRFADLRFADLSSADLSSANLSSANLSSADLSSADLSSANLRFAKNLPEWFINVCSRDIYFIFKTLKKEIPFLKDKLLKGEIDGTQYKGDCACLIGTLANADGGVDKVCGAIPFYDKGLHNWGEVWFYNIRKGDKPETHQFAKQVLDIIIMIENEDKVSKKKK